MKMDAQKRHNPAMTSSNTKSKLTKEMLQKFREENAGLDLQNTPELTGIIKKIMDKHGVSRERAGQMFVDFSG
jgi:hypothetical protein